VIVFEIFRRKGDCTFCVVVKIGGDSKKMLGLAAILFDKAFRTESKNTNSATLKLFI
jgi:hypothetical protein